MTIVRAIVPLLICSVTSVHSMENRSIQLRQLSFTQESKLEYEQPIKAFPNSPARELPLSVDIMKHGKTAARYLAYTTLPSLVKATDPSADVAQFLSRYAVTIGVGSCVALFCVGCVVWDCCLKKNYPDCDDSEDEAQC